VGNGSYSDPTVGKSTLFFGNEQYNISATAGVGIGLSAYDSESYALLVKEGSFDVQIPERLFIGDQTIVNGPHTDAKLSVDGKIIGRELFIHNEQSIWGWPDYVFNEDYELRSIDELKKFVETNKHLPGVADAKTIRETGIGFSATAISLLEKVEELSLYVIQLNEKIKELEKKLEDKH
jgi:hypothetical protein